MYTLFEGREKERLSGNRQYYKKQYLYYSKNGGTEWQILWETSPPLNSGFSTIFCDNKNTGVLYRSNNLGVFVTYDLGKTWDQFINNECISLYRTENNLILLLNSKVIYYTTDNGATWQFFNSVKYEDKTLRYLSMDVDELNKNILIGTTRGVKIVSYKYISGSKIK